MTILLLVLLLFIVIVIILFINYSVRNKEVFVVVLWKHFTSDIGACPQSYKLLMHEGKSSTKRAMKTVLQPYSPRVVPCRPYCGVPSHAQARGLDIKSTSEGKGGLPGVDGSSPRAIPCQTEDVMPLTFGTPWNFLAMPHLQSQL